MYPFGYECNLVLKVTIAYRKSVNNGNNEVKIFLYPPVVNIFTFCLHAYGTCNF